MAWYSDVGLINTWNFDTDTMDDNITLYAKWTILRTVSFNVNGGSAVPEQEVVEGGHASERQAQHKMVMLLWAGIPILV